MPASNPSSVAPSNGELLLVDPDAKARNLTSDSLKRKGYHVEVAATGSEALVRLEHSRFDLIILEMILPGISGAELMRRVRLVQQDVSIIVLTGQPSIEGAIVALRSNVVDYMLKPCRMDDLHLTIERALEERARHLRQQRVMEMVSEAMSALHQVEPIAVSSVAVQPATNVSTSNLIQVGALALDREKRLVTIKTDPPHTAELTEGEVAILMALLEKPNRVMTCNQLAKVALGYDGMEKWTVESIVRSSVFRLRNKLEPGPNAPKLIRTVRGRGYFFSLAA